MVWWIKYVIFIGVACFYLIFGIQLLISAYELNNPFSFFMTFFAANFIILICAALIVGFVYRMITKISAAGNDEDNGEN